jgi:hypothetical protein
MSRLQTQIPKIRIRIDLSELYALADRVDSSAAELLLGVLRHYNISADKIYAVNPDIAATIVFDVRNNKIDYIDEDIDTALSAFNCENIVELHDGYETAYACW